MSAFYSELLKKKIALPLFNRATYGRMQVLIDSLAKYPNIDLTLVLAGSITWGSYGAASAYVKKSHGERVKIKEIEVRDFGSSHYGISLESSSLLGLFADYFYYNRPDLVIAVADRFETLPMAMAASYQNIPLVHIQGGEITGNIDDKVRHALTKLADYHFVATESAKAYVALMGEDRARIWNTGCPSLDVIVKNKIQRFRAKEKYFLTIFHPETENADEAYEQTARVLEACLEYSAQYGHRCYWFYPNPDPGREEITRLLDETISRHPECFIRAINKEPKEFLRQLAGARLIVGNSSCGIRESSYLGVPAVNVGERQRIRERSWNVIDVGHDKDAILEAIHTSHRLERYAKSQLYGSGRAAEYIAEYIATLTPSLKGPLTYPYELQHRERHFGERRFHVHKKRRNEPRRKSVAPQGQTA